MSSAAVALALAGIIGAAQAMRAQELPRPSGQYAIGLTRLVLADPDRTEPQTPDQSDVRQMVVQAWYPAEPGTGEPGRYVIDSAAWSEAFGAAAVRRSRSVRPHARWHGKPLASRVWPVMLLSPGAGIEPGSFSILGEELASRGFVVLALGHPYEKPILRLADGRLAVPPPDPPDSEFVRAARDRIRWRVGDLRFLLSQVASAAGPLAKALPALRMDATRAVAIGHSRGAVAVLEACKADGRFRGCISLDGGVNGGPYYEDSAGTGPRAPALWLQAYHPPPSDSQLVTYRMSRAQWDSFDIRANRLLARARGEAWRVILPQTEHLVFSDLPWMSADSAQRAAFGRALATIGNAVGRFADAAIRGGPPRFDSLVQAGSVMSALRLPPAHWAWSDAEGARIDSLVDAARAHDTAAGIVVGVVMGDSLVHTVARGTADIRTARPMEARHQFRIGSITKQFTGLMLLQLASAGRVTLTAPVERFVPEAKVLRRFFPDAPPITLVQLATHTSGLAREPDDSALASGSSARWDTLVVRGLARVRVVAEPGTGVYRYSNFGYALLGLALSRIAREPYEAWVEREILMSLGMRHSGFHADADVPLATGYDASSGTLDAETPARELRGRGYKVPNGALYSTVADLARFIALETGGGPDSVLPRAALDGNYARLVYVNRRLTDAAGLGFVAVRDGDAVMFGHAGTVAGYDAITAFDPERRIGAIVLRNVSFGGLNTYQLLLEVMRVLRESRRAGLERPL